jgi:zinc-ribbon domain
MKCAQCGEALSPEARFCRNCGSPVSVAPPVPQPSQPIATPPVPSLPLPEVPQIKKGMSSKAIIFLVLAAFLLIVGGGIALWFTFFPPGVYVSDSFRKPHSDIVSQIQDYGGRIKDGMLELEPPNEKFYSISYKDPTSDEATIEATVIWKEGDANSSFGVLCCDVGNKEFIAFMISGESYYHLASHAGSDWYSLTGWLKLPKELKIQKNTPYQIKMVIEKNFITLYLGETFLAKIMEDYNHRGMPGLYAEGGKSGKTVIAFDEFKAKKNSMFQSDKPSK